jgi:eukaryotic-like serine/threonine-protein kinase
VAGPSARTLRPEDQIAHYRIVGPLGAGGMGEVYLAQDQKLDRNVALKILPPELVRSEERVQRFVLEAKSASSLSHPNIVTIYEIGQDAVRSAGAPDSAPVHFISMELVSGKTLATLIHEDKTDLRTLLGFLAQAADGLAKAHSAGIVHRDLKPGNIMVSADGFTKVLDFGLAKLTEKRAAGPEETSAPTRLADATQSGVVVGTAGYMSPEQVQGKGVDFRSDIFSFGCILYEAATRRRPFVADTGVETMHKILHDKPAPVEVLNPKAPAELRRLIRRCLAKSPEQRHQSMKDLAIELREIVDEYDALSASASSGSSVAGAPLARRRRSALGLWIGAGIVVGAVAGIALFWRAQPRAREVSQSGQNMRISAQTSRGDISDCALSPDGRYLAYIAGRAGRKTLRVRQVATGSDVEILPASDAEILNPSFSPDGNYLFYTAVPPDRQNYRALFQVASLGGTPRERAFDVDSRVSFHPDGRQLVFWRHVTDPDENRLVAVDLSSWKERVIATVAPAEIFRGAPAWSPDGKRIAGGLLRPAPNLESTIAIFDPSTGRREDLAKLDRTVVNSLAWLRDGTGIVSSALELKTTLTEQVRLHAYPGGSISRLTNDFNKYEALSTSLADDAVAAVRTTTIRNVWLADASGATPARRLTNIANPESSIFNLAPLDAGTIAYIALEDRYPQVKTIGTTGGETHQLTSEEALCNNVNAANGLLLFNRLDKTGTHVWRMGADGGGQRQLTSGGGEQIMELSGDGHYFMATRYDALGKLSVMSTEDGRVVQEKSEVLGLIGISPDSRSVLFGMVEKDAHGLINALWTVYPIEGGAPTATFHLPGKATGARWTPDSRAVTFRNLADPAWNVYRQAFDGSTPVPVTRFTRGHLTDFRWSPDGRKLAVQVEDGDATSLWVVEADGSRPMQVAQFTSERVLDDKWMPDGRSLAVLAGTVTADAVLIRDFR